MYQGSEQGFKGCNRGYEAGVREGMGRYSLRRAQGSYRGN